VFGIAAIPVTLAMGAAVDYSLASRAKTTLDTYADAAALSAVGKNYQSLQPETSKFSRRIFSRHAPSILSAAS